tara:strand:- start:253 stop:483 length:231 start_codon:yes stop_codon:yes gene_type:complete
MQKILNIISVISFVLVTILTAGTTFSYFWITNEENQEKLKKELIGNLTGSLPIPKTLTGPAIPTAPLKVPQGLPNF